VDFQLTPEQELVRDTALAFVNAEVAPHARDWDRAESMDR
jgi:alkylation response protein AidB-like acyl-CoA dehydrogenase